MTGDTTLFAHIISMFTNQTERAATEALGYILAESETVRRGVEQLVNDGGTAIDRITQVHTEVRGEDGERVDLVGFDGNGSERLLVELKFWAELTDMQPNTYLERLPQRGPAVLLFVVPKKSQPYGGGDGWWLYLNGERVWFGIYWMQWAEHGASPLWLWPEEQEARSSLRAHRGGPYSPDNEHFRIDLPIGENHDTVLNEVVAQLERIGNLFGAPGGSL